MFYSKPFFFQGLLLDVRSLVPVFCCRVRMFHQMFQTLRKKWSKHITRYYRIQHSINNKTKNKFNSFLLSRYSVDNESYRKLEKWFAEKYPLEWYFMNQINDNFSDLIKLMPDDYLMDFIDNPNFMKVQTRQEGDSKIIDSTISPFLLMMLGILLKTNLDISNDSVRRRAEVLIKSKYPDIRFPDIQDCPSCDTSNPIRAKYCMSCGTLLIPN